MSERKVLNKYYPPDFDPSKIPRMKLPRNRQYTVRLMAPFNMRCVTCGEYIYKGKKFNARKEDVEGEDYLGIRIYRFYIKCTRCLQEISFKTDPRNTDYEIEAGATRNFMALKLAEEQAQREEDERKEDEATNPMKLLENRTKQSKQELELLESLEELRDLNRRQLSVDYDTMLSQFDSEERKRKLREKQEEEDEKYIKSVFGAKRVVAEEIMESVEEKVLSAKSDKVEEYVYRPPKKMMKTSLSEKRQESLFTPQQSQSTPVKEESPAQSSKPKSTRDAYWNLRVGALSKKTSLLGLVHVKKSSPTECEKPEEKDTKTAVTDNKPNTSCVVKGSSGLSLLGSYSGSDSEISE